MRPLREAVRETDRKRIDQQKGVMRAMVMNAGFEVRPELGIGEPEALEILGLLLVVTLTGAIFDRQAGVGAVVDAIALPRFDDPSVTDTWTPTSVAAYAFFTLLYRPMES